jgi:cell division protein FtsI (penicillin-binding protein 3)
MVRNKPRVAKQLAAALGMNESALTSKLRKAKGSFLWIKRDLPSPQAARVKALKIPGVGFKSETRRQYPMGVMASHLLGFVGTDGVGLSGIENVYEKTLANKARFSGDVQLTIDAEIQQIVERELEWGSKKTGAKKGMAVVQDPWTGEILAMATWPPVSLDPENPPAPTDLRVPGLVDVFEPGSTFKIVTAAAAIEEHLVTDRDTFDGENGAWKVADITIHDHEPSKRMTFEEIIIRSSNIGTAKVAERIGATRLYQYARLFGFGVQPGSGLSGEAKGVLRPVSKWSGVSKYVVSFGQELGVTMVQLADAYSTIANGGILMEPRLVKRIADESGEPLWESSPGQVRRVVAPETTQKLTQILVKVVEKGTGVNAQIQWDPATKVAGKTGTAQKWDSVHHRYHELLSLVSFCGFFPADHPKLTMVVVLDEPEGRRWGGLDAAPIFRRIAEQLDPKLVAMGDKGTTKSL